MDLNPSLLDFALMRDVYNFEGFKPTSISWLPKPSKNERKARNSKELGLFSSLSKNHQNHNALMNLLEISMPTFLAKKYHVVNITELMKDKSREMYFIFLAAWFVSFNKALGNQLLSVINEKHNDYLNAVKNSKNSSKLVKIWKENAEEISIFLIMSYQGILKPPQIQDICLRAREFILEPCILIQLPWHPVLLLQWLTATSTEVLMFEKESLELRHWSLHHELIDVANRILHVISMLKERVTIGFAIHAELVKTHPQIESNLPNYILDKVVLPSVPILQFLISGNAHKIIKSVKSLAWSKENEIVTSVDSSTYLMNEQLAIYNTESPFNVFTWNQANLPYPFPTCEIEKVITQLKTESDVIKCNEITKSDSLDEIKLFDILMSNQNNNTFKLDNQERIDLTVKIIKEEIIDKGKIPGVTLAAVEKIFQTTDAKQHAGEIFDKTKTENTHLAIRQAMMYKEAYKLLIGSEKKNSVLSRILTLQLEVLEREQIIRLTHTCGLIFNVSPVCPKLDSAEPLDLDTMSVQLKELSENIKKQDRALLFSKFPEEWKQPVNDNETLPELYGEDRKKIGTSEDVKKSLENRIGRLVYNAAQQSFTVFANGGESYPHWQTVQYILPCLVAAFLDKNERMEPTASLYSLFELCGFEDKIDSVENTTNFLNLVHGIIKSYENNYNIWLKECKPRITSIEKIVERKASRLNAFLKEYNIILIKYRENIRTNLVAYTNTRDEDNVLINGFDQIMNFLTNWPFLACFVELDKDFQYCVKAVNDFSYEFMKNVLEISRIVWKVPFPGSQIPVCPKLGELYFANAVVSELEVVFGIATIELYRNPTARMREVQDAMDDMHEFRLQILRAVLTAEKQPLSYLNNTVEWRKKSVLVLYNKIKRFREQFGPISRFILHHKLPNLNHPEIRNAVNYFMNGNMSSLDNMLKIFEIHVEKKCRNCSKTQKKLGGKALISCEDCIKQNYPDVHYYCGKSCKEAAWKSQHMVEHLEFELGLSGFVKPSQ